MEQERIPNIYVVSDGRGQTCMQVLKAALVQFQGQPFTAVTEAGVRDAARVREIVEAAARHQAVIFYTLVGEETRRVMREEAGLFAVPTVDVLGQTLSALHDLFKRDPQSTPGLLYASEREEFDRHDAIDYTLQHDDGRRPDELADADVVLVGVSRASKSSTCFFLAYQGIKAANVPLIPGVEPLPQLRALNPGMVIGLRVNPSRLLTVREVRAASFHGVARSYVDREVVKEEVLQAHRMMKRYGWRSFDASYMAVEEIAREVMALRGLTRR